MYLVKTSLGLLAGLLIAGSPWMLHALQGSRLVFDVVSVKPNRSSDSPSSLFPLGPGDAYVQNGGLFSAVNQALIAYVRFGFKLGQVEVPGLPAWVYTERFDI